MSGEYILTNPSTKEAVRRLARVLYESLRDVRDWDQSWDDLSSDQRLGFYDAVLVLSDLDELWRVLFDNPHEDPVSGSAIDCE